MIDERPRIHTELTQNDPESSRWTDLASKLHDEPTAVLTATHDMQSRHQGHHDNAVTADRKNIYRKPKNRVLLCLFLAAECE